MSKKLGRRAYKVTTGEFTEITCYVMADSPSHAKAEAIRWDDMSALREDFLALRAKRTPELDSGFSEAALVEHGLMWTECSCGRSLTITNDGWEEECEPGSEGCDQYGYRECFPVYSGGRAYCSRKCADTYGKPDATGLVDGICLYEE